MDVEIRDLAASGLPAPSLVRMKVFTLYHRLIDRTLGRLSEHDWRLVAESLHDLFDA